MIGITDGTTKEQNVRATSKATAYQVRDNLEAMNHDFGFTIRRLWVDGSTIANNFLMQFQVDIAGVPVDVPLLSDSSGSAAFFMAFYMAQQRNIIMILCSYAQFGLFGAIF